MNAGALIILSNIDGIYDGSPSDPASQVIAAVGPDQDLEPYVQQEKSGFGRGGMLTKCSIARKMAGEGVRVIIANGRRDNILIDLISNPQTTVHTEFLPNENQVSGVKKWIAHSESFAKGSVTVNADAAKALSGGVASSLLLVGVVAVNGDFDEGDIINILDENGSRIGVGKSGYCSEEAKKQMGRHGVKPMVHYDYLYIE